MFYFISISRSTWPPHGQMITLINIVSPPLRMLIAHPPPLLPTHVNAVNQWNCFLRWSLNQFIMPVFTRLVCSCRRHHRDWLLIWKPNRQFGSCSSAAQPWEILGRSCINHPIPIPPHDYRYPKGWDALGPIGNIILGLIYTCMYIIDIFMFTF